jgi:hypothetical protein
MIAMAVVNLAAETLAIFWSAIPIALACVLVLSAALLFLRERSAQLIGIATTTTGIACYIYLFVRFWSW